VPQHAHVVNAVLAHLGANSKLSMPMQAAVQQVAMQLVR
jgi:hypothetical protein